ncbi:MAG: DUF3383 family protein [Bradymonadaceae bacterium]
MAHITHDGDISINVFLSPEPARLQGFGTGLLVVPKSNNSLNGNRVIVYAGDTAVEDAEQDESNGYISAATLDAIKTYFGQDDLVPRQEKLVVGHRDDTLATPETYPEALSAIQQENDEWYLVAIAGRADTDIDNTSSEIESSYKKFFVAQTDSADFKDSSPASGTLPDLLTGRERTFVNWHDTDGEWQDMAIMGARGAFDLDNKSPPWFGQVKGVADLDQTNLSGGDVDTIKGNNGNVMLPFGPADKFVKEGKNMNGRAAYVMLTADWFENRLQYDVAEEIVKKTNFGEKIGVSENGQTTMAKLVRSRFQQGEDAGHFKRGTTSIEFPTITQTNRDNETIPLKGSAIIKIAGQKVDFNFRFTRN